MALEIKCVAVMPAEPKQYCELFFGFCQPSAEWASWAGAAATVFAVCAAFRIASVDRKRQEKRDLDEKQQRLDEAALYASHLVVRLEPYIDKLRGATIGAFFDDEVTGTPVIDRLRSEIASATTDVTLEDVARLIPLPNRAAYRLAHGLAVVDEVHKEIERLWERHGAGNHRVSDSTARNEAGLLKDAADMLAVATDECRQIAAKYVSPPTAEEIYGE